jgi:glutamine synthetase
MARIVADKKFGFKDVRDVRSTLSKNPDIKFMRFVTADMHGERPCGFTVPVTEFGGRISEDGKVRIENGGGEDFSKGFDASSLYPERINESDKNAVFDFSTARVLPWDYHTKSEGFDRKWKEMVVFGDVVDPLNGPYKFDSRNILKNVLKDIKVEGIADTVYIGPELEFYLFKADDSGYPVIEEHREDNLNLLRPVPVDKGGYFKGGMYGDVRKEVQLMMMEMGYRFEYDHHEVANSQHEIDMMYLPALEMADFVMLYRYVVKRVASSYGLFASFMPKPISGYMGSGMHTHQSLFKSGKNIFHDPEDENGLSLRCMQYIAGLMRYVPEIMALVNPWVNSYKRLEPGYEAPVYICCDVQNRSSLIRIPGYDISNPNAVRIELRNPDAACNPYLSFAAQITAGVKGIEEGLKPPPIRDVNVFELSLKKLEKLGIRSLPSDLEHALEKMEKSALVKEMMGEEFLSHYLEAKKAHIKAYKDSLGHRKEDWSMDHVVSRYEVEELLPIL